MSVNKLVKAIESVLPERRPIYHHEPFIGGTDISSTLDCLYAGIAKNDRVTQLEEELSKQCGTSQVVCVSSGTAALHVALLAAGVQPGEEVLAPALTFAATAHAVSYCGAIPNFVDGPVGVNAYKLRRYLERETIPNPDRVKQSGHHRRLNRTTGRVVSALIVVDLLGFPADWPKLSAVADEFGLTLIEDSAQALGATLGNQPCGSFGKAAILSFNNNKIVTGNGGGAVLTNDEWIAAKAYQLASTARTNHPWKVEHEALGFNYRMGAISAALALSQLGQINKLLTAKKALLAKYEEALPGITFIKSSEAWHGNPNYWLITILVDCRDELLEALNKKGIYARALFTPLNQLPYYKDCPHDKLEYAEHTFSKAVCLPSGVGLC